ncbi:hypothetical protein [Streptomyces sp. A1136]|uniref:hypothetical protein n=1 Tax=Streptomyces sp. A1136 TaxID=2563102 RepID=UPI00109E5B3B|nr:hypothetical protein [Streptomyces sp. A1136]THA49431.1 hypothetical protein E6R62_28035 [Streptomyces sp. A1136]
MARFDIDRGTLRSAGFVALLTVVFLVTNTAVAAAADGTAVGGGLLGPLDVMTGEDAPLSGYQLEAVVAAPDTIPAMSAVDTLTTGAPPIDVVGHTQRLVMSGLFTLVRLLVGLCCWLIGFVFKFPLLTLLTGPAQHLADAYKMHVVGALGLEGLLLSWAFVFGLILFVRGKVGTGLGEIAMTLVIAALAASAFIRPDYLLGKDGPLDQTHQAALEVASITTGSYFSSPGRTSRDCASAAGPSAPNCVHEQASAETVVDPIQKALTDALVVKPYMLLQYGRILDPKNPDDAAAYKAHVKWVNSSRPDRAEGSTDPSKCEGVFGPLKESCERRVAKKPEDPCRLLFGPAKEYCNRGDATRSKDSAFATLLDELGKAGPVGKACAAYAKQPTWDRVWSVVALLVAVIVVALMIVSMAVVMFGAQGADAAAAAGGPIAWVWAMLPGPSRMLLWRWLGVFIVSALVSFMAAMALPLFGIAVDALLSDSGPDLMVERLLLVDALAVAFLIMHRRILAATAGFGQHMATRMRFKKIGGSHLTGDNSELGAALSMHGPSGAGRFSEIGGGFSAAHGAFGARLRSLGSLAALSDGSGMPMSPGRLLGDALAEGRRGVAPLAVALRGAHAALIGPKPGQHPAAAQFRSAANGGSTGHAGGRGEMVVDQWTGEVLHDPATDRPLLGSRLHARASRLRGYRVASRTARLAYGATLGLPRNLGRARQAGSQFTEDARTQLRVAANGVREDAGRWTDGGRALRNGVDHTGQVLATAWQVHDPMGSVRNTALAAAIATAPLASDGRATAAPRTSLSAPRIESGHPSRPHPPSPPASPAPVRSRRSETTSRSGAESGSATRNPTDAQAEANAARLRAMFDARAAERRRREGGEQ